LSRMVMLLAGLAIELISFNEYSESVQSAKAAYDRKVLESVRK
jgi:hypothetical protein